MSHRSLPDSNGNSSLVAIAIDKDKGSQSALKWAVENIVPRGHMLILVHVNTKSGGHHGHNEDGQSYKGATDPQMKELFLPFRCYCTRKDIYCEDVVLEDTDVAKSIVEFISQAAIEKLVVGAPSKGGFIRFNKTSDIPFNISKGAPDFCTVYVISKGKVQSMRNAVRQAPAVSHFRAKIQSNASKPPPETPRDRMSFTSSKASDDDNRSLRDEPIMSPFMQAGRAGSRIKSFAELNLSDSGPDISFVSSGRPSIDRMYPQRLSNGSEYLDRSFESSRTPNMNPESYSIGNDYSFQSAGTASSWSSQNVDDVEAEMRRLKQELRQTMDMYSAACREALTAKQKALELNRWKAEEEQRVEEAKLTEESALAMVEKERAKCRAAIEAAQAKQRIAEMEAQKRYQAEMHSRKNSQQTQSMGQDIRYRRYTIEEIEQATEYFSESRKVGEGGYGPVYKCYLDHTPVAIKVLRPDAAQGKSQFQQEVQVLSCIRHPNMVLLLGACPEYGCLVYEYMANGSLEDRLFCRGNSPVIPWQHRFRIAAEISTSLLFLHQTKPEALVHRDLKPANILLDHNYVSKISDVGLARLVPPSVADTVTQYHMTSAAGTFCYIDPEYQQTGMLGVKSDVYSLGVMLLQIITAKQPMGLAHHVGYAIERGNIADMLDPSVTDWPVEEAKKFAEIALKCTELRRKDRPDLATAVLPELNRLRALGEENMSSCVLMSSVASPMHSQASIQNSTSGPVSNSEYEEDAV